MIYNLLISIFSLTATFGLVPNQTNETCMECSIYVPNAFSPNADARNDEFFIHPEATCQFSEFTVQIFDRWGNLLFTSDSPGFSWDGQVNNQDLPQAVYLYAIQYTLEGGSDSDRETLIGQLNLIR
ncbi:MAG: gliding motility-associated C-terminal domain-containing protein [Saprospiraceae bacterium]|nr:gliding motility-associated C-terminal domain-containing protein [Saprospiraceae bacterium]